MKKIVVYDFDSTLFRTPEKNDENMKLWKEKMCTDWKGGWWGNKESLNLNIFDINPIDYVYESALKDIQDSNSYVILLTGRIMKLEKNVKEVCSKFGLCFDRYYFNNTNDTLTFKLSVLQKLKDEFKDTENFVMWEDRVEHIPHFISWGKENYSDKFLLNHVK